MNVGAPQRLLPPGKPESLTQPRKGWTGSGLRQWHLCLTRVPLCAAPALTVNEGL